MNLKLSRRVSGGRQTSCCAASRLSGKAKISRVFNLRGIGAGSPRRNNFSIRWQVISRGGNPVRALSTRLPTRGIPRVYEFTGRGSAITANAPNARRGYPSAHERRFPPSPLPIPLPDVCGVSARPFDY